MDKQLIKLSIIDKWSLLILCFRKRLPKSKIIHFEKLYDFEFLSPVDTLPDGRGGYIEQDIYCLSDKYKKFKIDRKDFLIKERLPIIISLIALIKAFQDDILWLLQSIMKLLK